MRHLRDAIKGLAKNPALPAPMIRRLFAWPHGLGEVAGRPDLTEDMCAELIDRDEMWQVHTLALNRQLPLRFRMELAGHHDEAIRTAVVVGTVPRFTAGRRSGPGNEELRELFELLLDGASPRTRTALAECDKVPSDVRGRLASDPEPEVRSVLAQCWTQAPEDVRRLLLTDPDPEVRAAACSTYFRRLPHPVPPRDLVPALLADPVTRAGAVGHAVLDPEVIDSLVRDPDSAVRAQLAGHPDLPTDIREVLAADPSPLVRLAVFARRDTPDSVRAAIYGEIVANTPALEEILAADEDDELPQEYSDAAYEIGYLRPKWIIADAERHVDSPFPAFRAAAALSRTLPEDAVRRLLDDEDGHVRIASPSIPLGACGHWRPRIRTCRGSSWPGWRPIPRPRCARRSRRIRACRPGSGPRCSTTSPTASSEPLPRRRTSDGRR